jgi:uncharacterized membrane protein
MSLFVLAQTNFLAKIHLIKRVAPKIRKQMVFFNEPIPNTPISINQANRIFSSSISM